MNYIKTTVKLLTITASILLTSCSLIYEHYGESCNSHAYLNRGLEDFIKSRYHYNSPVRMAIIPFSVAANISSQDMNLPGLGNEMAWKVHAKMLEGGQVPIVEVFNRQGWPRKKEEFFAGNFGAIDIAREAGYDLVMVGYIEPQSEINELNAYVKILDAESGITVYYGNILTTSRRRDMDAWEDTLLISDKIPSKTYLHETKEKLAVCIADATMSEPEI